MVKKEGLLVGDLFSSLFPPIHRSRVQELTADLVRSSEPAHVWSALPVGDIEVPMRLAAIVEENECSGILVTLEVKESTPEADS